MARNPKQDANLKPIRKGELSKEEAKRRGRQGGIKSGEKRREKRDARESMRYILGLRPTDEVLNQMQKVANAVDAKELTNLEAMNIRIFAQAMSGNIEAWKNVLRVAGYDPEENRAERESINADARREVEMQLKQDAIASRNIDNGTMAVGLQNEEGSSDVVIYLPKIEDLPEEDEDEEEDTSEGDSNKSDEE